MRWLLVVMIAVFACGCSDDGLRSVGVVNTGPTTFSTMRIQGPTEVKVNEAVQYRAFAKTLGASQETDVTATVFWVARPSSRLTVGQNGSAVGVTEGPVELGVSTSDTAAYLNVNVVGAPAAEGEVAVTCPSTIGTGETRTCTANYVKNGVSVSVTTVATWSSSAGDIAGVANNQVIGIREGTSTISATHEGVKGSTQIRVVVAANGVFDTRFVPVLNNCGGPIRGSLTGLMFIEGAVGSLVTNGETQEYALTIAQGADGRVLIRGTRRAGDFQFSLELIQTEPNGKIFAGREDILGPGGCTAQYSVTMEKI